MSESVPPFDNPKRRAYERRRKYLLDLCGNKCARCPAVVDLQFDCIQPMGATHHGMGMYDRMIFYVLMSRNNNLQLLCPACHQIKSAQDKFNARERALAENRLCASSSQLDNATTTASPAPSKSLTQQQPGESDWQYSCRLARERWGIE